mgnify:CR=1 FL=1
MVRLPARGVDLLAALAGYGLAVGGVAMRSRPAAMVLAGALPCWLLPRGGPPSEHQHHLEADRGCRARLMVTALRPGIRWMIATTTSPRAPCHGPGCWCLRTASAKASAVYRCVSIPANVLAMFPKGMYERLDPAGGRRPSTRSTSIIGFASQQPPVGFRVLAPGASTWSCARTPHADRPGHHGTRW